jgi:hypothetical protein
LDTSLNLSKFFGLKGKLGIFCSVEGFFELHSCATEGLKRQKMNQEDEFFSQLKKL